MNSKAPRDGDDETRIIRERSAPIKVERLDLEEELFADLPSCVAASARRRHSSEVHMKRQSYDGLLVDEHEAEMAPSIFCVDESAPCGIAGSLLSNTPPGVVTKMERLIQLNENTTTAQLNVARSPSGEKRLCNICHRKAFLLCASCAAEKCHLYKIRTKQTTLEAEKRRLVESIDEILSEEMHLADELSVTSCTVGNLRTLLAFKRHKIRQMKQRLKRAEDIRNMSTRYGEKLSMHIKFFTEAIEKRGQKIEALQENVSKKELRLQAVRQSLARRIFTIFPIASVDEVRYSAEDPIGAALTNALAEAKATSFVNGRWVVLDSETDDDASVVTTKYLTIVGCRAPDDSDYRALKSRLMCVSAPAPAADRLQFCQSWMAALGYAMQLVNRLAIVYDINLPFEMFQRDLALADSWTEPLLDTDVFKLNACVVLLCLARELPPKSLAVRRPFANLLLLSECLSSGGVGTATRLPSNLANELWRALEKLDWREHERSSLPQQTVVDDWEQVSGDELPVTADFSDRRPSGLTDLLTSASASVASLFSR